MEQIKQLKAMRDDAWSRIKATADYKLATSLDSLIGDLESALGIGSDTGEGEGSSAASGELEEESEPSGSRPFFSPANGASGSEEDGKTAPFETDMIPPMDIAEEAPQSGTETDAGMADGQEAAADSLLASADEERDAFESSPEDDDDAVMSELSQLIHSGFASGEAASEESSDTAGEENRDAQPEESGEAPTEEIGPEEEDALIRAMRALDEDLSRSALKSGDDGESEK